MTDFVTEVEQELIDATNFKPERNYRDRQMYLGALLKACIHDLDDDQFDALSDAAAEWANMAAEASRDGHPLPDFIEEGAHEISPKSGGHEATASDRTDTQPMVELAGVPAEAVTLDVGANAGTEQKKEKKGKGGRPKGQKKVMVSVTIQKPKKEKKEKTIPPVVRVAMRKSNGINEWGITLGTKADTACKMAAQVGGTTMKEIKEVTGGNKYNLFNRLKRYEHNVRFEEGRIYLEKPAVPRTQSVEK